MALLAALCLPALAVGVWTLLRASPLSAVERVRVEGVQGRQAARIEAALRRAARGMSTLHVEVGALRAAVAGFPVVRDLRVQASFPHGLRIEVIEQRPVAVLIAAGGRTAVAADGVVLGTQLLAGTLPSVRLGGVAPLPGGRVGDALARAQLAVLGAAPGTLLGWVQSVSSGSEGLLVTMRTGLVLYFGNATRAHAKWLAAARVLADPSSAGASYIDVRLPERPVAASGTPGGLSGAAAQSATTDPSAAALAAKLDEAVSGGAAEAATTPSTSPTGPASESGSSESATGESGTGASGTGASGTGEPSSGEAAPSESSVAAAGGATAATESPAREPSEASAAEAGG